MAEQDAGLTEFWLTLRKRRVLALGLSIPVLLVCVYLSVALAPIYRSTARILIENQDIPTDFVRAVVTGYGEERVQLVRGRVMTRSNLREIVRTYDLYPELHTEDSVDDAVPELASNVFFEMEQPEDGTLAFTLSYEHPSPRTAEAVASEIVNLYLRENILSRTELTQATLDFLGEEADRLQVEIADIEAKLASFKEQNAGALPNLVQMNTQLLDRTERDLEAAEGRMRELTEERAVLRTQLTQISPYITTLDESGQPVLGSAERLQLLQQEFLRLSAIYSANHPDLVRIRREISVLTTDPDAGAAVADLTEDLATARAELQVARQRYSPDHPDIRRLERTVSNLEAALEDAAATAADTPYREPNNPVFIETTARIERVQQEIDALTLRRQELSGKLVEYEQRLGRTPEVERTFLALTRDYESLQEKYYENRQRQEDARLALRLEQEQKGDRFSLIDPPRVPSSPVKPNRPAIIILGVMLAMVLGLGGPVLAESLDSTVRSSRDVRDILNTPPIALIPVVNNASDVHRIWMVRAASAGSLLIAIAVIAWTALAA